MVGSNLGHFNDGVEPSCVWGTAEDIFKFMKSSALCLSASIAKQAVADLEVSVSTSDIKMRESARGTVGYQSTN